MSKEFPFPDKDEALGILKADPAYRKIPAAEIGTVLETAWRVGESAAKVLLHKTQERICFSALLEEKGFHICTKESDNLVGATRYFAIIEPERKVVTVFRESVEKWAEHWGFAYGEAENLILSHEYFHYLESTELGYTSRLYQVPLFQAAGVCIGKTGIRAMSEIAADAFAGAVYRKENEP